MLAKVSSSPSLQPQGKIELLTMCEGSFQRRWKMLNPTSFTASKNRNKNKILLVSECCFPNLCIHLASNLIVPPCGLSEIHCGLCVCLHMCVCVPVSVCCGRRYSVWLKKTVSVPLLPSEVVTFCVCLRSFFFMCVHCMRVCL